jgi:YjbE family integral membrane protein
MERNNGMIESMWRDAWLLLEIMLVNIVLSGDNAVVIAMASRYLPPRERRMAMYWGTAGAVALRILLTVAAVVIMKIPFLDLIGAMFLFYIAVSLVKQEEEAGKTGETASLMKAIGTILAADLMMSLDNVVAVASIARNNFVIMCIGVALSIPIMIWCSVLVMKLLHRFPALLYIGAGILGYSAGQMVCGNPIVNKELNDASGWLPSAVPVVCAFLVVGCSLVLSRWRVHKKTVTAQDQGIYSKIEEG